MRYLVVLVSFLFFQTLAAQSNKVHGQEKVQKRNKKRFKLPDIDLSNWKVTIPEGSGKGGALSVSPPDIKDYATNALLKPYMFNDSVSGALVFFAIPTDATTANTKYSRSELREQMAPGNDKVNWTFKQGGELKVKMQMDAVSRDANGKYHKVIIAQIHGRLTEDQKALIGAKDNNAPPILKIYWQDGKIRVKTKELVFAEIDPLGILHEEAWGDDKGRNFNDAVDFRKFTIEVKVSEGKMVVSLNNNEFFVYDSVHIERWGIFENYFKVGNYFQTRDKGAFASVKVYDIEVKH